MKTYVARDGHRYTVSLLQEPGDSMQTLALQRDDGWLGTVGVPQSVEPMDLVAELLEAAIEMARSSWSNDRSEDFE